MSCLAKRVEERPSSAALLAVLAQLAQPAAGERALGSLPTWRSESDTLRAARAQSWLLAASDRAQRGDAHVTLAA